MIRWGKVTQILDDRLHIHVFSLVGKIANNAPGNIHLIETETTANYHKSFLPNLKIGDVVAVHWNQAIKILEAGEVEKLSYWTKEVIGQFR